MQWDLWGKCYTLFKKLLSKTFWALHAENWKKKLCLKGHGKRVWGTNPIKLSHSEFDYILRTLICKCKPSMAVSLITYLVTAKVFLSKSWNKKCMPHSFGLFSFFRVLHNLKNLGASYFLCKSIVWHLKIQWIWAVAMQLSDVYCLHCAQTSTWNKSGS